MKQHKITLTPEAEHYLGWLCDKEYIQAKNRKSIMIERLIRKEITKYKISERPVYEGDEDDDSD